MANLKGKDYIGTQDLSDDELGLLLDTATDLKRERSFQGHGMIDVLRAIQSV